MSRVDGMSMVEGRQRLALVGRVFLVVVGFMKRVRNGKPKDSKRERGLLVRLLSANRRVGSIKIALGLFARERNANCIATDTRTNLAMVLIHQMTFESGHEWNVRVTTNF